MAKVNEQQSRLLRDIQKFYGEESLADVILVAPGREFPCSRLLLAASSDFFRAMFMSPVREKNETRVELADIDKDTLAHVLKYIYSGEITVTESNVQNLYMAAHRLALLPLERVCSDFLMQEITIENCIEIYTFASYYADEHLQRELLQFIEHNFVDVSKQKSFVVSVDVKLLQELLLSNNLNVECEETVLVTLLSWIQHDVQKRLQHLRKLFKFIRIPLVSDKFLREKIIPHPLIENDLSCIRHITSFLTFVSNAEKTELEEVDEGFLKHLKLYSTLRIGMKSKNMLIFSGGSNSPETRSFSCFDPITRKNYLGISSHPSFDFKYRIDFFKLVTVNMQFVYFLGGILYENHHFEEGAEAFKRVYLHDPVAMKWAKKASMLYPRCAMAACVRGTEIYIMGGKSKFPRGDPLDSVEMYDSVHDSWCELCPMPCRLYHHTASVCDGAIFVFGGSDVMDHYSDDVLRYDLTSKDWSVVRTNLLKPRAELSSVTINDQIYVLGGCHKHAHALIVEIYVPARNTWRYGSDFPDERKFTCVTGAENGIYVYGGHRVFGRMGRATRSIECKDLHYYDPEADVWSKVVKSVQYGNSACSTFAKVNTSYLHESDCVGFLPP